MTSRDALLIAITLGYRTGAFASRTSCE